MSTSCKHRIAFIHPDLGIGGAEKAVLDAATALKESGHYCEFFTAHHEPSHCFKETVDGTFKVTVAGDWLPRSVCGRFYALFAYLRMIYAAIYLVYFANCDFDLIFCDQISACIPILNQSRKPVIFYCHFPDMLLTQRKSFLKKLYRYPIDWLEEVTTGKADRILVNSRFTAGVFADTFKGLAHIQPDTCYPIPNFAALDQPFDEMKEDWNIPKTMCLYLSINRYERKKNLALAIKSMKAVEEKIGSLSGKAHLIMAGGYDERVVENKEYYLELRRLTQQLNLGNHITFLRSFSDNEKRTLLNTATCLLYTPDKEHFGIVPVEAMYSRCPVIAVNSGGPLETVEHESTGFLSPQTDSAFCEYIERFINNPELKQEMGDKGRERMVRLFSYDAYRTQLNNIIEQEISKYRN